MKKIKLVVVGALATVVAFLIGLTWGFIALALLIILTFFEIERRETDLKKTSNYVSMEIVGYISNHSFMIGVAFTIIGMSLLSPAFLIKGGGAYWHEWQKEISWILRVLQFRLFLIALLFLAVGHILINRDLKGSEKL